MLLGIGIVGACVTLFLFSGRTSGAVCREVRSNFEGSRKNVRESETEQKYFST